MSPWNSRLLLLAVSVNAYVLSAYFNRFDILKRDVEVVKDVQSEFEQWLSISSCAEPAMTREAPVYISRTCADRIARYRDRILNDAEDMASILESITKNGVERVTDELLLPLVSNASNIVSDYEMYKHYKKLEGKD